MSASYRVGGNRKYQSYRGTGDKWQSKTLFLLIFDLHSLIVDSIFDCRLPDVSINLHRVPKSHVLDHIIF